MDGFVHLSILCITMLLLFLPSNFSLQSNQNPNFQNNLHNGNNKPHKSPLIRRNNNLKNINNNRQHNKHKKLNYNI